MATPSNWGDLSSSSDADFNQDNAEDLSHSDLTEIPEYVLNHPKKWKSLQMSHNQFPVLPREIGQFVNLVSVDVSNNGLTQFPDSIVRLKKLKRLTARNNLLEVSSIPKNFGRLPALETLNLGGNSFDGIPMQFTELRQLRNLYIGGNKIKEVPAALKHLRRLEVLYLGGNCLTEIPAELGNLFNLVSLVLCDNQLDSLPPTLINLRRLQSLSLHNNRLSTLPPEIVSLNLVELSLRNNPLVVKFVQDLTMEPQSLLELAGRVVKVEKIPYTSEDLPANLVKYLTSAQRCVNPKCKGVYFSSKVENVKFVDFCGKYRLPLLQYLCSPKCRTSPAVCNSETETDDEDSARNKMKKVLLG